MNIDYTTILTIAWLAYGVILSCLIGAYYLYETYKFNKEREKLRAWLKEKCIKVTE